MRSLVDEVDVNSLMDELDANSLGERLRKLASS